MLKSGRISLTVISPLMRVGLKLCLQPLWKNLFPAYGFIFIKITLFIFLVIIIITFVSKGKSSRS